MNPVRRRRLSSLIAADDPIKDQVPQSPSAPKGTKGMSTDTTATLPALAPGTIRDSGGQIWTKEEVQALVNQVANFTKAAARLGLPDTKVLRDLGIKTPAEYVRDKAIADPEWLPRFCLMHGSIANASKHLNVSVAHIEGILKGHLKYEVRLPVPDHDATLALLQRFGSILYVARYLHSTPALVKKAVPEWREHQDATKTGDHSTKTGTIGELYYAKMRAPVITESPAETNHNHPGYDYVESEYGKVNVKAIPIVRGRWTWEIDPGTACEGFALVQLDAGKTPVGMTMITKTQLENPPHGFLSTPRSNGDIAISTKEQFEVAPMPGAVPEDA